ncbi:hypothetical protein SLEP1_g24609 [Rubroshorea leprosula]|uniref:Uncharacterized protein n=1 Tax=Rubroshorea leprosula TaxID=152421 RepID=A0AAV5JMF8_9ROSI|nr:hypothetical protein SLEP1_g24609 [Rubroshorea leprosula]
MLAHVDMLVIKPVRTSDPASGDYTLVNRVPASGRFITLDVTCRGDVYFVPVLYPFFVIAHVGIL